MIVLDWIVDASKERTAQYARQRLAWIIGYDRQALPDVAYRPCAKRCVWNPLFRWYRDR